MFLTDGPSGNLEVEDFVSRRTNRRELFNSDLVNGKDL